MAASMALGDIAVDSLPSPCHARRGRPAPALLKRQTRSRRTCGLVVAEMGGQYEEGFDDVRVQLINYFTYKAARTVLHQLHEMNPPSYMWLYKTINHLMVNAFSAYRQRNVSMQKRINKFQNENQPTADVRTADGNRHLTIR